MHIINYNRSFLLDTDSFSFIVFKRLYHASFKLNIVSFSRALPYGPLLNPLRGSDCAHRLIVSCKTQNFFSLLTPWFHILSPCLVSGTSFMSMTPRATLCKAFDQNFGSQKRKRIL